MLFLFLSYTFVLTYPVHDIYYVFCSVMYIMNWPGQSNVGNGDSETSKYSWLVLITTPNIGEDVALVLGLNIRDESSLWLFISESNDSLVLKAKCLIKRMGCRCNLTSNEEIFFLLRNVSCNGAVGFWVTEMRHQSGET